MDADPYLQVIVAVVVAVIGWIVAHRFTAARDLQNRRRQLRTEKLLEVYEKLEVVIDRPVSPQSLCHLEDAVSMLQLLGSRAEIKSAIAAAKRLAGDHSEHVDITDLVDQLRESLRREIGLEEYKGPIARLRLTYAGRDPRQALASNRADAAGSGTAQPE